MNSKILLAVSVWIYASVRSDAQQLQRHQAIVVYIFNFAKNIQWTNESALKEFHFTIVTKDPVFVEEFNKLAKTKTIKDKRIIVAVTNNPNEIGQTQLVFLDNEFESALVSVLGKIEGKNVLLVTDRFTDKRFVMINFVQLENNKLQFQVNKANIINQKLVIGPDMIMLGGSEIDVASLYKESQQSLLGMQRKLDNLVAASEDLKLKIKKSENEIEKQKKLSIEQNVLILNQQKELAAQKDNLQFLQAEAKNKSTILELRNNELQEQKNKLTNQETEIRKGENILKLLHTSIDSLNSGITKRETILSLQGYTIASQSRILYGLVIIIAFAIFSTFILLKWYRQKNNLNKLLTARKEELERANKSSVLAYEMLGKKSEALQLTIEELNFQKMEILAQRDIVATQNEKLIQSQEEIAAQRDLVAKQNEKLEESRGIIEKQNEEIRQRNENLEVEVENRTKELVEYNQQLEQFAFISAHNLRAPVARILGLGNVLELSNLKDEALVYRKLIETTKELDRVVKDLNTILEIKKNNTSVVTEINLDNELQLLKINLEKEIAETCTMVEADFSLFNTIRTVRPYFDSILINLISNAIKYRHPNRTPIIKIRTELMGNFVYFKVSDNGLGMDLNLYGEKLFKLYSRFHDHVEGKGLGLYLVKTQVVALGGRIEVESEVNKGTTFNIFLKARV